MKNHHNRITFVLIVAAIVAVVSIAVGYYTMHENYNIQSRNPTDSYSMPSTVEHDHISHQDDQEIINLTGQFIISTCITDGPGCGDVEFIDTSNNNWIIINQSMQLKEYASTNQTVKIRAKKTSDQFMALTILSTDIQ